jgi:hypothetical protein
MQEGLVLEDIEVAPGLLHRVVHRAVDLAALGAREATAGLEINLDVEPLLLSVEVRRRHIQGDTRPSTARNRSMSRMASTLAPLPNRAVMLPAVQQQALGAR